MCHRCDNARRITETLQGATEAEMYGNHGLEPKDYLAHTMEAIYSRKARELADAIDEEFVKNPEKHLPPELLVPKEFIEKVKNNLYRPFDHP